MFVCLFCFLRQGFSVQSWLSWNSLCRPGWLELRNPPASASQVLELKACSTTAWRYIYIYFNLTLFYVHWCEGVRYLELDCYRQLWAAMQVLGIKPMSSGRAVGALNHWPISLAPRRDHICMLYVCDIYVCACAVAQYIYTYIYVCVYMYIYIHIYVYICIYMYIHIYTHTHTHTHIYIYIYTHTYI